MMKWSKVMKKIIEVREGIIGWEKEGKKTRKI